MALTPAKGNRPPPRLRTDRLAPDAKLPLTLFLSLATLGAAVPASAQDWTQRPAYGTSLSPVDIAAQARAERDRLRAGQDQRQSQLEVQQLRTDQTLQQMQIERGPTLLGAQGPAGTDTAPPLSYSDPRDRMSAEEMSRRLDAMDARTAPREP